jgi:hypothetical protein
MIVIMSSFLFFACANASEFNKKGEESILGLQVPPCKPNPKRERCDDDQAILFWLPIQPNCMQHENIKGLDVPLE